MNPATGISEKPTQTLEVEIERLLPGGLGLAHAEGRTILVSLAAPGDVVRVQIERTRGKVSFASISEIIKASPLRVEPPCPYFGRCGGCDFQQLTYEAQLAAKVEMIRDCLHRIARIAQPPEIQMHPSSAEWQYRARAGWQLDANARRLGYFERGSHSVCDVEVCAVLAPELQSVLERLRTEMRQSDFETASNMEIEAVVGDDGLSVHPSFDIFPSETVTRTTSDETYEFNARTFFQINHGLLETLIRNAIHDASGDTAIDLYCGVGLFTLPLARRFKTVLAVESNRTAVDFARRNLEAAELTNVCLVNSRVADWLRPGSNQPPKVDLLLLDPPRTGAEPGVIQGILDCRPTSIVYVSCDPATLARDLKTLLAGEYKLDSVTAFDMFPQTHHVETVAKVSSLDRRNVG